MRHQVPFFESLVRLHMELNPSLRAINEHCHDGWSVRQGKE